MKKLAIVLTLFTFIIVSCDKEEEENNSDSNSKIYFRWTQDLNASVCPTVRALNYRDNNNAVPNNAESSKYYSGCIAGTYQGQYEFTDISVASSAQTISFTYVLQSPPTGYARYYSKRLCGYASNVNRCISFATENNLVYTDEKL